MTRHGGAHQLAIARDRGRSSAARAVWSWCQAGESCFCPPGGRERRAACCPRGEGEARGVQLFRVDSFSARLPAWWLPQNDQNKVPPDEQSTAKQSAGMVEPAADSAKDPAPASAFGPVVVQGSGGGLSSSLLTSLPQKTNSAPVTPLADLLRNVDVRALHCIGACCCHYPSRTIFPPLTHRRMCTPSALAAVEALRHAQRVWVR